MKNKSYSEKNDVRLLNRLRSREQRFRVRLGWAGLFCLCLICALSAGRTGSALAEQNLRCSVSSPDHPELAPVSCRKVKNEYRVFIPGNWDITRVVMHFDTIGQMTAEDQVIVSGEVLDLSKIATGKPMKCRIRDKELPGKLSLYHGSRIPSVHISVDANELSMIRKSKDSSIREGRLTYVEADGSVTYDGALTQLKGRGNSTFGYKKKPYQFKLASKTSLSGMGEGKTWILLANWEDISQLRNQLMLDLARYIGMPYSLRCQPVDLYINEDYQGLYLLTEKIQIGNGRVNITNLENKNEEVNPQPPASYPHFKESKGPYRLLRAFQLENDPEDVTGGYLIELEKAYRFEREFTSGFQFRDRMSFIIKEPTQCSVSQVRYLAELFRRLHVSLNAGDGYDSETGVYYADLIDFPSFTRKYLIEEFSKNYDAQSSSQFMFKDSDLVDPKIYAGPCWDYDLSCGNIRTAAFEKGSMPTGDYLINAVRSNSLWHTLAVHPDFRDALEETYRQVVSPALAILTGEAPGPEDGSLRSFDSYRAMIERSAGMNYSRWAANDVKGYYTGSGKNFSDSCNYLLDWIVKRKAFLDQYWKVAGED